MYGNVWKYIPYVCMHACVCIYVCVLAGYFFGIINYKKFNNR